jgi:hypothetical protein
MCAPSIRVLAHGGQHHAKEPTLTAHDPGVAETEVQFLAFDGTFATGAAVGMEFPQERAPRQASEQTVVGLGIRVDRSAVRRIRTIVCEVRVGHEDPVMFADNLYDEGQVHIHTVAISTEENVRKYEPRYIGQIGATPNPKMLSEIARRTRAKCFPSPDAEVFNRLLDDLGEGGCFQCCRLEIIATDEFTQ